MTSTNDGPEGRAERNASSGAPVGTVAQEAAWLVEVLTGRHAEASGGDAEASGVGTPYVGAPGAGRSDEPDGPDERAPEPPPAAEQPCTCGGVRPAACAVCPVCQLIAFVQRVNPEAIDRLADAVELAATGLRDLATVQRTRHGGDGGREQNP